MYHFDYRKSVPNVPPSGKSVTVAVSGADVRTESDPTYVGMIKNGFGIPNFLYTTSKEPLAQDFSTALVKALDKAGYAAQVVKNPQPKSASMAVAALGQTRADRKVLITISEWESDTLFNTDLKYAVALTVYDGSGRQLASVQKVSTGETIVRTVSAPILYGRRGAIREATKVLEQLVANPAVQRAL